jgi:exopolysaccharide biosynthesis polyprenyl glycosylphosphotransferase
VEESVSATRASRANGPNRRRDTEKRTGPEMSDADTARQTLWAEEATSRSAAGDAEAQHLESTGRQSLGEPPPTNLFRRLLLTDIFALQIAWWISAMWFQSHLAVWALGLGSLLYTLLGLSLLSLRHLYRSRVAAVRETEVRRLATVAFACSVAASLVLDLRDPGSRSGWYFVLNATLTFASLTVGRSFFDEWVRAKRMMGDFQRPIVIVGNGEEVQHLLDLLQDHPDFGLKVHEVVRTIDVEDPTLVHRVSAALDRTGSHGVLLTAQGLNIDDKRSLIEALAEKGVHVHISGGLWGIDYRRVRAVPIAHEPLLYVEPATTRQSVRIAKRAMDIVGSVAILVLTSPLMLAASFAILLEGGRPVLFRQRRVGKDGAPFEMLKLRSMVPDAEDRLEDLQVDNEREGPLYKNDDADPRVTKVGKVIRALSIDELPQLVNVLQGDMSLVGPRPALPSEVEEFDDDLLGRLRAKPGITGLWQIESRDSPSFAAYKRLDLFYVNNRSSVLDMIIILMTVQSVLGRAVRSLRKSSLDPVPTA